MSRTWWKPLTYAPKIEGVKAGIIRQTIRYHKPGTPMPKIGMDNFGMFTWSGKPYWSPWGWRQEWPLVEAIPAVFYPGEGDEEIWFNVADELTTSIDLDELARLDGIYPPTAGELLSVLLKLTKGKPREYDEYMVPFLPMLIWRW